MANTPNSMILPQAIRRAAALATAAKTTYADATNAVLLVAGGANGSIVRKLTAIPLATVTATQLQLYRLRRHELPAAQHGADGRLHHGADHAGCADRLRVFGHSTLYLPASWSLYVGIGVALSAGILFNVELSDF